MPVYQAKHNFTAGEVSPLVFGRTDFDRHKNGCRKLYNMVTLTQGPVTRRSGFRYIASLNDLGIDLTNPLVREVPFIFNEQQAYVLVMFMHISGVIRTVFATGDGLLVYPDPPPTECPTGTPVTEVAGDVVYLDMPIGWDIEKFDHAQSGDYLYCAQSSLAPHAIVRHGNYCWTVEALSFTSTPADWSSVYGWPESVTFIQQRLGYGGTIKDRQTVWLSRAGDFSHFGALDPANLVDADAVTFTLDSGTQNKIQWMQTVKQLHIGTIGNEWVVTGNGQNAITPSSVLTESPTNQGSEKVKPLRIGLITLFIEQHGRIINEFIYDYNYDSYKASDISVLAPHLTDDSSIVRWTYQQTPNSIVWAVREDGDLLGLTYQRQHNVIAWHHHESQGYFKEVCSIPGNDREDDLWAIAKRDVGGDVFYIEKKSPEFRGQSASDGRFLDSHLVYAGVSTNVISGLSHLEGKTVSILANGSVHPDVVVSSGSITLNRSVTNAVVGLNFISEVNPLLPDIPTNQGTSQTRTQRIISLNIELYRSLGFSIGTVDIDGYEHVDVKPFRVPTDLTGQPLPLFSGTVEVDGFEGWDNKAYYFIRQSQPLPLTVVGVVDFVEVR